MRVKPEKPFILRAGVRILQQLLPPRQKSRSSDLNMSFQNESSNPTTHYFPPMYAGYFPASLKPNTASPGLGVTAGVARSCLEAPPPSFQICTVGTVLGQHGTFFRICEMIRTNQVRFHLFYSFLRCCFPENKKIFF